MTTSFTDPTAALTEVVEALVSAGFELGAPVRTATTVLDTFDGRLHDAGLRLELRTGPIRELVLTDARGAASAHLVWSGDAPRLIADLPPGPFGGRVAAQIKERSLLPMFAVTASTREAVRRDRRGKPVVHVRLHDDVVPDTATDAADAPRWVSEIIGVAGHPAEHQRTIDVFEKRGMHRHDNDLIDVALALTGGSIAGRSSSPTVPLDPADDALDAFRAVLRNLASTIADNLPGTVADLDPEFLHELRVAIRRTRSVLAQGKGVLPTEIGRRYRNDFADLGAATGRTRDLDVYVMGWSDTVAPLHLDDASVTEPVLCELAARRRAAHAAMIQRLESDATRAMLGSWQAWLDNPDVRSGDPRPIGPFVARRIAKAQATVLAHGRAIAPGSPAEDLHDLRKDAKKLRYLFECFGGLLPAKARKSFVSQLKALQDNLGDHQDAEVQLTELRELAHDLHERHAIDTDALLVVGRLIDNLDRRRVHERDDFVTRFAAYDTKANHHALDALLASAANR